MTPYNCDSEENFINFKEEYSDEVADIGYSAIVSKVCYKTSVVTHIVMSRLDSNT